MPEMRAGSLQIYLLNILSRCCFTPMLSSCLHEYDTLSTSRYFEPILPVHVVRFQTNLRKLVKIMNGNDVTQQPIQIPITKHSHDSWDYIYKSKQDFSQNILCINIIPPVMIINTLLQFNSKNSTYVSIKCISPEVLFFTQFPVQRDNRINCWFRQMCSIR